MLELAKEAFIVDITKLSVYRMCPRRYFYRHVLGWTTTGQNHNLVFGIAWHVAQEYLLNNGYTEKGVTGAYDAFLEEYRKVFDDSTDLDYAPKSPGNALVALMEYVRHYKGDSFKVIQTELSGIVPVWDDEVFGNMAFKIDGLVEDDNGVWILEHKTTSSKNLGPTYIKQWSTSFQVQLYIYAARFILNRDDDPKVVGARVNAVGFGKSANKFERIKVRKSTADTVAFLTSLSYYLSALKTDMTMLTEDFDSMKAEEAMYIFPCNVKGCVSYFRLCPYQAFCDGWPNPLQKLHLMPAEMVVKHWNPLADDVRAKEFIDITKRDGDSDDNGC